MSVKNIEVEKIEYLNAKILKADINNVLRNPLQKGDDFKLDYTIKAIDLYNLDQELIRVIIDATIIVIKDGAELNAGARFEIDNYFRYPDLKNFARIGEDRVLVEFEFADVVKGLAYSTARGVILSKLSDTFLEGAILPVKMSTEV